MDRRQEVLLEVGTSGTGALSAGLLVSMKPGVAGSWDMEIAVDTKLAVESVLVSPDGAACLVHPLSPTQAAQGIIHYCTVSVKQSGPGMIVEVLGPDQVAVPGLSAYLTPARQRSFPLIRLAPGDVPAPSQWGPAGAQRWEKAVNLVGAWRSELGIVMDVLVDDNSTATRIGATTRPDGQVQQTWLAPFAMGLICPSLARLWLSTGANEVELTFHGTNGDQIEEYRNTISVASMPVVDPVSGSIAAPRPAPRMNSLLQASRFTDGGSSAGPAQAPSFPARPVFAPPPARAPHADDLIHTSPGTTAALQQPPPGAPPPPGPPPPLARSPLAARLSSASQVPPAPPPNPVAENQPPPPPRPPQVKPRYTAAGAAAMPGYHSGHGHERATPAVDVTAAPPPPPAPPEPPSTGLPRRRTSTFRVPKLWPQTVGANSAHLGPTGGMTDRHVLTLLSAERTVNTTRLELFLDDHGLVSSIALGNDQGIISEHPLVRITPFSPLYFVLELPESYDKLILFGRNAYGEAFQDLTAAIDVDKKTFKTISLDREFWSGQVQFTKHINLDTTLCCVCRRDVTPPDGLTVYQLAPSERDELRKVYALMPETRGICKACHEEKILSKQIVHTLLSAFTAANLRLGLQRLIFGYGGALLLFTALGKLLLSVVSTLRPGMDERIANGYVATLLAFLAALPPWPALLAATRSGLKTLTKTGQLDNYATLGVPSVLLAVGVAGLRSYTPPPSAYANVFWKQDLHLAVGAGFVLALLVAFWIRRMIDASYEERLRGQRRIVQVGVTSRLIPRLMSVGDMMEFDRAIDKVLLEGVGALEYQVFAMNPDTKRFKLKRAVGPIRGDAATFTFKTGDENVLGIVAMMGRSLAQSEIATDKSLHPGARRSPIPSLAAVPIWIRGEVCEVYNISKFRGINLGPDLPGLLNTITVVAGRGLTEMLRAAEKAEDEARLAAERGPPESRFNKR